MLRVDALDRCAPWGLAAMARRHGVQTYLNVGHSNHFAPVLGALRNAGSEVVVMIHDLIPITHPTLVPPKQPARFAARMAHVATHAALVIAVSEETARALRHHWAEAPRMPPVEVAALGVPPLREARPKPCESRFLMVGTLEPRKNHCFILKVWSALAEAMPAADMPSLRIIGQPGWCGAAIAQDITAHPHYGRHVFLDTSAGDETLLAACQQADTLLYPSLVEGFGLPPFEALAHGLRPICSDLAVLRAGLGNDAVYADPNDVYSWVETIKKRISGTLSETQANFARRPSWQDHFGRVSAALAELRDRAERP